MINPIRSSTKFIYNSTVAAIEFLNKNIVINISNIFKSVISTILSPFSKYEKDKEVTLTDGRTITIRELKPKNRKIKIEENSNKTSDKLFFIYNLCNIDNIPNRSEKS